jgi:hypothetical protein
VPLSATTVKMATNMFMGTRFGPFRAKKLDVGCFVNIGIIRDHSKRKAFAQFEPERYGTSTFMMGSETARIVLCQPRLLSMR